MYPYPQYAKTHADYLPAVSQHDGATLGDPSMAPPSVVVSRPPSRQHFHVRQSMPNTGSQPDLYLRSGSASASASASASTVHRSNSDSSAYGRLRNHPDSRASNVAIYSPSSSSVALSTYDSSVLAPSSAAASAVSLTAHPSDHAGSTDTLGKRQRSPTLPNHELAISPSDQGFHTKRAQLQPPHLYQQPPHPSQPYPQHTSYDTQASYQQYAYNPSAQPQPYQALQHQHQQPHQHQHQQHNPALPYNYQTAYAHAPQAPPLQSSGYPSHNDKTACIAASVLSDSQRRAYSSHHPYADASIPTADVPTSYDRQATSGLSAASGMSAVPASSGSGAYDSMPSAAYSNAPHAGTFQSYERASPTLSSYPNTSNTSSAANTAPSSPVHGAHTRPHRHPKATSRSSSAAGGSASAGGSSATSGHLTTPTQANPLSSAPCHKTYKNPNGLKYHLIYFHGELPASSGGVPASMPRSTSTASGGFASPIPTRDAHNGSTAPSSSGGHHHHPANCCFVVCRRVGIDCVWSTAGCAPSQQPRQNVVVCSTRGPCRRTGSNSALGSTDAQDGSARAPSSRSVSPSHDMLTPTTSSAATVPPATQVPRFIHPAYLRYICPLSEACTKRYKNIGGLRYHLTHSHSEKDEEEVRKILAYARQRAETVSSAEEAFPYSGSALAAATAAAATAAAALAAASGSGSVPTSASASTSVSASVSVSASASVAGGTGASGGSSAPGSTSASLAASPAQAFGGIGSASTSASASSQASLKAVYAISTTAMDVDTKPPGTREYTSAATDGFAPTTQSTDTMNTMAVEPLDHLNASGSSGYRHGQTLDSQDVQRMSSAASMSHGPDDRLPVTPLSSPWPPQRHLTAGDPGGLWTHGGWRGRFNPDHVKQHQQRGSSDSSNSWRSFLFTDRRRRVVAQDADSQDLRDPDGRRAPADRRRQQKQQQEYRHGLDHRQLGDGVDATNKG
ncbi:hypothetical protein BC831DRAFT_458896, partial [Entophlyctis helioformis]